VNTFEIHISTVNDATKDMGEIARILTDIADRLREDARGAFSNGVIRIRDINGNRVGFAALNEE
jgi:hypothetical protein